MCIPCVGITHASHVATMCKGSEKMNLTLQPWNLDNAKSEYIYIDQ